MAILASVAALGFTQAEAEPRPFRLEGGHIVLPVKIEGREVLAIIDTGAERSSVEAPLAKALGMRVLNRQGGTFGASGKRIDFRTSDSTDIDLGGGLSVRRMVNVFPSAQDVLAGGAQVIIGMDVMYDQAVVIDYEARTIDFIPSRSFTPPAGTPILLTERFGAHVARLDIGGGVHADFQLDTGASTAVHLAGGFARNSPMMKARRVSTTLIVGIDGTHVQPITSLPRLDLRGATFTDVPASVGSLVYGNAGDGVIGTEILRRFRVVIDYGRNRLWLTPNSKVDAPLPRDRVGLMTAPAEAGRVVTLVATGSPAEAAGFKVGDLVSAYADDKGAPLASLSSLSEGDGVTVVMADGATRTLTARAYY